MSVRHILEQLAVALRHNRGRIITDEFGDELLAFMADVLATPAKPDFIIPQYVPEQWNEYVFACEKLEDVLEELSVLHRLQWDEVEHCRQGLPFDPDYLRMMTAERAGRYVLFTIRKGGVLVGNCGLFVSKSLHTQLPVAIEDALFIVPGERRGWLAKKFMQYMERCLQQLGITEIEVTVKVDPDGTPKKSYPVLLRMGYAHDAYRLKKVFGSSTHEN